MTTPHICAYCRDGDLRRCAGCDRPAFHMPDPYRPGRCDPGPGIAMHSVPMAEDQPCPLCGSTGKTTAAPERPFPMKAFDLGLMSPGLARLAAVGTCDKDHPDLPAWVAALPSYIDWKASGMDKRTDSRQTR